MTCKILRILLVALAASFSVFFVEAHAMYARMTNAQLIAASDLILLGRLTGIEKKPDADGTGQRLVGVLQAEEILKGPQRAGPVWLAVKQSGGLQSSSDIAFSTGQTGLWFLRRLPGGGHAIYAADHPQRFVPYPQAKEMARAVSDALNR